MHLAISGYCHCKNMAMWPYSVSDISFIPDPLFTWLEIISQHMNWVMSLFAKDMVGARTQCFLNNHWQEAVIYSSGRKTLLYITCCSRQMRKKTKNRNSEQRFESMNLCLYQTESSSLIGSSKIAPVSHIRVLTSDYVLLSSHWKQYDHLIFPTIIQLESLQHRLSFLIQRSFNYNLD